MRDRKVRGHRGSGYGGAWGQGPGSGTQITKESVWEGLSEDWKWRVEGAGEQVGGGSTHGSSLPSLSQVLQTA